MAKVTTLPLQTYTAGTHSIPEVSLPTGVTQGRAMFDLTHLTTLTLVMTLALELSFDNGGSWTAIGGSGLDLPKSGFTIDGGGVVRSSKGQIVTESGIVAQFTDPTNSQRRLRGTITLSEDFLTQITADLT